jgi:hypothetical protein
VGYRNTAFWRSTLKSPMPPRFPSGQISGGFYRKRNEVEMTREPRPGSAPPMHEFGHIPSLSMPGTFFPKEWVQPTAS